MMLYPSIDDLLEKLDSKYTLVTVAAKRARELRVKYNGYVNQPQSYKYVGEALEEIVQQKIGYEDRQTQREREEETETPSSL